MLKAILFDFDGVIIDSYEANIACYRYAFRDFKYPIPTRESIIPLLGLTAAAIVEKLLPNETPKIKEKITRQVFLESDRTIPSIRLINGAETVLENLEKKYKLAIVSNRRHVSINKILNFLHLESKFNLIIGKEDVQNPKPHHEPIQKALGYFKLEPEQALYVGDMEEDIMSAKAAGIKSIFIAGDRRNSYGANYTLKTIKEFPDLFKELI